MSATSIAGVLATPAEFDYQGKTYQLAPLDTLEVCGQLEKWAIRRAFDEVEQIKPDLLGGGVPDIDGLVLYQRELKAIRELVSAGHYRYGERLYDETLSTIQGTREAVYRSMRYFDTSVTRDLVAGIAKDSGKWLKLISLLNEMEDPKPKPVTVSPADNAVR